MSKGNAAEPAVAPAVLPSLIEEFREGATSEQPLDFHDLVEASDAFTAGYLRLTRRGASQRSIGVAMLCATVNVYDIFELQDELPGLLRSLATVIETGPEKQID